MQIRRDTRLLALALNELVLPAAAASAEDGERLLQRPSQQSSGTL